MPKTSDLTPRIYVACLAAYNNGKLHGAWIDANQDADAIETAVKEMLAKSPEQGAEEWRIDDEEGFCGLSLDNMGFAEISNAAELIERRGCLGVEVMKHCGIDAEDAERCLDENYEGEWLRLSDWAWDYLESVGMLAGVSEEIVRYFDVKAWARDQAINGDIFTIELDGMTHVFRNR